MPDETVRPGVGRSPVLYDSPVLYEVNVTLDHTNTLKDRGER
jgi:hypothetical protein